MSSIAYDKIDWTKAQVIMTSRKLTSGMFGLNYPVDEGSYFENIGPDKYGYIQFRKQFDVPVVTFKPGEQALGSLWADQCFRTIYCPF